MQSKKVLVRSEDERWLELTVGDDRATARVGGPKGVGEPFPFSFENLGYVLGGIGYQAWGGGSHFSLRREKGGFAVEFQGPFDRGAAVCHLSTDAMRTKIDELDLLAPSAPRASMV